SSPAGACRRRWRGRCCSSRRTAPPRPPVAASRWTAASRTRSRDNVWRAAAEGEASGNGNGVRAERGPMIGFGAFLSLHPPQEQWALARRVEALDYHPLWTGDHVSFHGPIYESLTLLASYASVTQKIRLGTAVYLLALRHPTIAAKVTSTLDALSGGRLIFGVGVGGENPKEFEAAGVPHQERGARVTEGIDVVRALWRDTPASFKGRFTSFEGVSIAPKPVQRP